MKTQLRFIEWFKGWRLVALDFSSAVMFPITRNTVESLHRFERFGPPLTAVQPSGQCFITTMDVVPYDNMTPDEDTYDTDTDNELK